MILSPLLVKQSGRHHNMVSKKINPFSKKKLDKKQENSYKRLNFKYYYGWH